MRSNEGKVINSKTLPYISIFTIAMFSILFELIITRILNLKTWNHVVYTIIPFAILGIGIGSIIAMITTEKLLKYSEQKIVSSLLILSPLMGLIAFFSISVFPISLQDYIDFQISVAHILKLSFTPIALLLPFTPVGFLTTYLFQRHGENSGKLYFFDMLGASFGALIFFPVISTSGAMQPIIAIFFVSIGAAILNTNLRKKVLICFTFLVIALSSLGLPEFDIYKIDPAKGWEWIPGNFEKNTYEEVLSEWHPIGRTNAFKILNRDASESIRKKNVGTFALNLSDAPLLTHFSNNFLAGTPAYHFGNPGMDHYLKNSTPFSISMEAPYMLARKSPKVVVIGTGGGRDLFIAKSHGAQNIVGAEINPATYKAMSKGGILHEITGEVYTKFAKVHQLDGRHLAKSLSKKSWDLIILNGVDTFSGLSSGAYMYAESYLYTKNAINDYLDLLKEGGVINFNRWVFPRFPRETLKLFNNVVEVLRERGFKNPGKHISLGRDVAWGILIIRNTEISEEENSKLRSYFESFDGELLYPPLDNSKRNAFNHLIMAESDGRKNEFELHYPFDISSFTDDTPFFYKFFKLSSLSKILAGETNGIHPVGGVTAILSTIFSLFVALIFCFLFIFLPTFFIKSKTEDPNTPSKIPFILYFMCIGTGFMFFEIPLMQKFVLLLGSPIYSISILLMIILLCSSVGSLFTQKFIDQKKDLSPLLKISALLLGAYALACYLLKDVGFGELVRFGLPMRIVMTFIFVAPLGFILGFFFPAGLYEASQYNKKTVAWAWSINLGFTVLSGILSIVIAQFTGFSHVILMGSLAYLIAALCLTKFTTRRIDLDAKA